MALTNILREPRREITETVVGLAIVGTLFAADYLFAEWFERLTVNVHNGCPWPLGMIIGVAMAIIVVFLMIQTHSLGEVVCNTLERGGVRLRPRQRVSR